MIDLASIPGTAAKYTRLPSLTTWTLAAAVNDERVLKETLLASPVINHACQWIAKRNFTSAGKAYNAALDESRNDIVVFAHQDVYLPASWLADIDAALQQLAHIDPQWAVLGCFGVTRSSPPQRQGFCYSTGLRRMLGAPLTLPIAARTLDEFVLIVRKSSGLRFDEQMPGFHLYATDLCLEAEARCLGAYIASAFCIHNANGIDRLPFAFWRAYLYLRRKWWQSLPVTTCCTTLTKSCLPIAGRLASEMKNSVRSRNVGHRTSDVEALYARLVQVDPRILAHGTQHLIQTSCTLSPVSSHLL